MVAFCLRCLLILFFTAGGFFLQPFGLSALLGAFLGASGAGVFVLLDLSVARLPAERLLWGSIGLGLGFLLAIFISRLVLESSSRLDPASRYFTELILFCGLGLVGARYSLRVGRGMASNRLGRFLGRPEKGSQ